MAEINGGRSAARQLKRAGIDTAFGVVAGPMIEVMAEMEADGIRGDYAFGLAAMEVETAARVGANVVFVVSNNGGIAGIERSQAPRVPPHVSQCVTSWVGLRFTGPNFTAG